MTTDDTPRATVPLVDLAAASLATFAPLRGHVFTLVEVDATQSLTLDSVDPLHASSGPGRSEPFALVFSGSVHSSRPQGMYRIEHPHLGTLDLFLVPITPEAQRARYEAVFS